MCIPLGGSLPAGIWRPPSCQSGMVLGLPQCYPGGAGRGLIFCSVWEIYWTSEGKDCGKGCSFGNGWSACWWSGWICACHLAGYVLTWSLAGSVCLSIWVIWLWCCGRATGVFSCIYTGQCSGSSYAFIALPAMSRHLFGGGSSHSCCTLGW